MPTGIIASGLGALVIGILIGVIARSTFGKRKVEGAEIKANKILQEAKNKEQEMLIAAKERTLKFIEKGKQEENERRRELKNLERQLLDRQNKFDAKLMGLEESKAKIQEEFKKIEQKAEEVHKKRQEAIDKLQSIAGLSKDEAKDHLFNLVEQDQKEALLSRVRKMEQEHDDEIENKAKKILSLAIQRFAASHVVDSTTTNVSLPSDDMKGRIIGKEGRNIKALERLTGCEIIIDDTPESITISGFSPVRRQIAKRTIEMLMKDGRIQPAKIEDTIELAKKELAREMKKAGEDALYQLGIPVSSIDPKLVSILGRLKFRTSYGQNVLQHSIEVARISGMIAEELGADVKNCKQGGLFHDIGKAVDHDMQGAHPEIGYNIMKKFGWPEDLCYQSIAHHEDRPRTLEGIIVKAADAISGARPGARRTNVEDYLQRLQNLEDTANSFEGVEKAYAIQAGREVRVFVRPDKVDDYEAHKLARDIAKKIESSLTYPGEVRITIIRETRVSEYAR